MFGFCCNVDSLLYNLTFRCRFEKQARLKKLAQSPKDKADRDSTAINIPIAVPEGTGKTGSPVHIPVRHTSMSSKNAYWIEFLFIFLSGLYFS